MSAITAHRTVIGLDGVERQWDEVFATGYVPGLGLATITGYVVRRTFFDGRPHEDIAQYPANDFGLAVEVAQANRIAEGQYAVVDTLHGDVRLNG